MVMQVTTMKPETIRRCRVAQRLMDQQDLGLSAAARRAKTTSRTLKNYFQSVGIKIKKVPGGQYRMVLPPKELRDKFLRRMMDGESATQAAKNLHTSVKKMRYQRFGYGGKYYPILKKNPITKRWEPNFVWVSDYSVVTYGYLLGLGDTVQGHDTQMGPKASATKADPAYADIWWQVDFDSFESTLDPQSLIAKYKKPIMDLLKKELETATITNAALVALFGTNAKVAAAATASGRTGNFKITELENLLERYDIHMDDRMDKINMGVDDSLGTKGNWVLKRAISAAGGKRAQGRFQVMFMRRSGLTTYPSAGPKTVTLRYSINNE
jgi:hypothetical protein